ncbi:MAG TPA: flippase-like domain-containing protein, partial [Gammaproteobacteria bacterium]|nr:flippase-like domain-containing protein [Gammaproteobacteria bacterium]
MRNKLIIALKIAISISVLITIVTRLESQQIISLLQQTNSVYLLIAMILSLLAVPVAGLRWRLLAEMLHFNISTATATRATFAGLFVGQVLPGGIGSDVIRGWMV